jgi:hypothetical protein
MRAFFIVVILALVACNPLRHYNKVVNDPFRNTPERQLLSRACVQEFPAIRDTSRTIREDIDSSDYLASQAAINALLDSLNAHLEREAKTADQPSTYLPLHDSMAAATTIQPLRINPRDSLRIIRGFLRVYKPAAVIHNKVVEVPVKSSSVGAYEHTLQASIDKCRTENEAMATATKQAQDARQKTRTTNIWLIVIAALAVGGNVFQYFKWRA